MFHHYTNLYLNLTYPTAKNESFSSSTNYQLPRIVPKSEINDNQLNSILKIANLKITCWGPVGDEDLFGSENNWGE